MKIEIDQSGKIEETHRDTVLAMANGVTKTVRITARTKRRLQDIFRRIGEPRSYVIHSFTTLIYLLIEPEIEKLSDIVIDGEYPGYESTIIALLKRILSQKEVKELPDIRSELVGKKANAHIAALATFQRQQKANKILSYETIYAECFTYKNGRPVLKHHL